jgi:hypothetical protein
MQTAVDYRLLIRRYLLGDLTEPERQLLEDKIMCESGLFRELLVVEDELIDEYVCDSLSDTERTAFEASFLHHNEERHRKLRFASALKTYLSRDPKPQPVQTSAEPRRMRNWGRSFSSLFMPPQVAMGSAVAVAFLAVILGVTWSVVKVSDLQNDLAQIQAVQRESDETVSSDATRLATESLDIARDTFPTATLLMPGGMRDSGQMTRIHIEPETLLVKFELDVAMDDYESYRVILVTEGVEVLRQDLLKAQDLGDRIIITLELPATVLPYGDYQIRLEGTISKDQHEYMDTYNFRAIVQ